MCRHSADAKSADKNRSYVIEKSVDFCRPICIDRVCVKPQAGLKSFDTAAAFVAEVAWPWTTVGVVGLIAQPGLRLPVLPRWSLGSAAPARRRAGVYVRRQSCVESACCCCCGGSAGAVLCHWRANHCRRRKFNAFVMSAEPLNRTPSVSLCHIFASRALRHMFSSLFLWGVDANRYGAPASSRALIACWRRPRYRSHVGSSDLVWSAHFSVWGRKAPWCRKGFLQRITES